MFMVQLMLPPCCLFKFSFISTAPPPLSLPKPTPASKPPNQPQQASSTYIGMSVKWVSNISWVIQWAFRYMLMIKLINMMVRQYLKSQTQHSSVDLLWFMYKEIQECRKNSDYKLIRNIKEIREFINFLVIQERPVTFRQGSRKPYYPESSK